MSGGGADAGDPWAGARRAMVEEQLAQRGIRDPRVLAVMREVPRHEFVPAQSLERAYADAALPAWEDQTISQPWMVATMLEAARLAPHHRVLEIGTGTGYQTALLSRLAAHVYSIERLGGLARTARGRLERLGCRNVSVREGDGTLGWQEFAPYARVLAAAAAPQAPEALLGQLEDGGVLVVPVGGVDFQTLEVWTRHGRRFECERRGTCRFVPLIGRQGWPEDPSR